jgi:carbonic anhydrase
MSDALNSLFANNRKWADRMSKERPDFFEKLAKQQSPKYLWIGCSDSRVPANEIVGLDPGEVFVHRNVANVVVPSDLNALSVIQFAVEHLRVEHIMVVGHYGCGGVIAAARGTRIGLVDNWLRHVQDVRLRHRQRLNHLPQAELEAVLCEMNVLEQVGNVALSNVMQDAWARGQNSGAWFDLRFERWLAQRLACQHEPLRRSGRCVSQRLQALPKTNRRIRHTHERSAT